MTRTDEFEQLRPLLFSIAYRILGSVSEAEDAVQETWPDAGRGPHYRGRERRDEREPGSDRGRDGEPVPVAEWRWNADSGTR